MTSPDGLGKYGLLLATMGIGLLGGCLQGGDTLGCGQLQSTFLSKQLIPGDPDFYLGLDNDSAIVNSSCPVQFQFEFAFSNDSLQAIAYAHGNLALMPLQGLQTQDLFHLNSDSMVLAGDWAMVNGFYNFPDSNPRHFYVSASASGGLNNNPSNPVHGNYYIRTRLLPGVSTLDSSVTVSARIWYYAGGPTD